MKMFFLMPPSLIIMKKDFQKWNTKKEFLHKEKVRPFFHEREIWFCTLGVNIGFEQDGSGIEFLRPVVIIKKFNNEVFWGLPLTKNLKKSKHYYQFFIEGQKETSTAILSQIRLVDAKRLQYKMGNIDDKDLVGIKKRLAEFLQ